eukprot:m.158719 g.158719  ORF g.158719 m.158719 type:complete len:374 (-) comp20888_c0_seq4:94-1215(-)
MHPLPMLPTVVAAAEHLHSLCVLDTAMSSGSSSASLDLLCSLQQQGNKILLQCVHTLEAVKRQLENSPRGAASSLKEDEIVDRASLTRFREALQEQNLMDMLGEEIVPDEVARATARFVKKMADSTLHSTGEVRERVARYFKNYRKNAKQARRRPAKPRQHVQHVFDDEEETCLPSANLLADCSESQDGDSADFGSASAGASELRQSPQTPISQSRRSTPTTAHERQARELSPDSQQTTGQAGDRTFSSIRRHAGEGERQPPRAAEPTRQPRERALFSPVNAGHYSASDRQASSSCRTEDFSPGPEFSDLEHYTPARGRRSQSEEMSATRQKRAAVEEDDEQNTVRVPRRVPAVPFRGYCATGVTSCRSVPNK